MEGASLIEVMHPLTLSYRTGKSSIKQVQCKLFLFGF